MPLPDLPGKEFQGWNFAGFQKTMTFSELDTNVSITERAKGPLLESDHEIVAAKPCLPDWEGFSSLGTYFNVLIGCTSTPQNKT